MSGLKIAALYGFRPNALGLCGPKELPRQQILKEFLAGKISHSQILSVMRQFRGAYPYYELIARKNKVKTGAFNKKVVEAYWIGNELLDKVSATDLRKMVVSQFSGPGLLSKKEAIKKAGAIPENSKPHHSFHVLVIGSVTGSVDFTGNTKLKDLCRVGWGRVKKLKVKSGKLKVIVEYQPLVGEKKIKLGKLQKKEVFWDREIVSEIKIGDWVSFHWNFVVQKLNEQNIVNLFKYTKDTLDSL
ncbi:MAG: hypothetical protein HY764_04500 [Candidatus Portnoybacteria bacterium]|nr:hypothetical protein [Candidatus Portnoybacteria bacterium]